MTTNFDNIINEYDFINILKQSTKADLLLLINKINCTVKYELNHDGTIFKLIFDSDVKFDFTTLNLIDVKFNIEIQNKSFNNINITKNIIPELGCNIVLNNIECNNIFVLENENIYITLIDVNCSKNILIENNKYISGVSFNNASVDLELKIQETNLAIVYIENSSKINQLALKNCEIELEGIFIKSSFIDDFRVMDSAINKINLSENADLFSVSLYNSSLKYFNITTAKITSIFLSHIKDLDEFTIYKKSDINDINIYLVNMNRFLTNDNVTIKNLSYNKKSNIGLLRFTDNCKLESLTIKDSNILNFIFYQSIEINIFESDDKSIIGDFDIFQSSIKSLSLTQQNSSFNFFSTTINFLKLYDCTINSLNILNGCKIDAYIIESKIDKVEFKRVNILKDTSISFLACRIYSIVMEELSVNGNLYFRDLEALEKPLTTEWSDINKYSNEPNVLNDEDDKKYYELQKNILKNIQHNINQNTNWIYKEVEIENSYLQDRLIKQDYLSKKIDVDKTNNLIELIKDAHNLDKIWFEKNLLNEIKKNKINRIIKWKNDENLNFNLAIIEFIWRVIGKIKTYDLSFQNINKPLLRFYQSSLGITEFSNCKFEKFEFQYNSTNFLNCVFFGTEIPHNELKVINNKVDIVNENDIDSSIKLNFYTQKIEFYNQFKKIYEKQGNIFEAGLFNSKWSENQQNLLLLKANKPENYLSYKWDITSFLKSLSLFCNKEYKEVAQDVFTFNLNRISNQHGESWLKSLFFILVPLVVLYIFFILSIYYDIMTPKELLFEPNSTFAFDNNFLIIFEYHIKDFFSFLNPARRLDFFHKIDGIGYLDWISYLIDFIARIILAFGVYQLIVAFRKNAKK